jgi:hydrogenase maturation factor
VKSGVGAMHDVTEGGIFGALWEMAEASDVGLEIDLKKIPLRQETVEICELFDVNPYELISSGCMLMAATDGNALVREIEKTGIKATIIGKATAGNDRILINEDEHRFLEPPKTDELYKVIQ